jgi:hypothetical protein
MMGGQDISNLGIPRPSGLNINKEITYSLALLATTWHQKHGRQFIDFLRSPLGQMVDTNSGFTGLTPDQLDGVKCYARPVGGVSVATDRNGDGSCDGWLKNNH